MQLLYLTLTQGRAHQNTKKGLFPGSLKINREFDISHKIKAKGHIETFALGLKLFLATFNAALAPYRLIKILKNGCVSRLQGSGWVG